MPLYTPSELSKLLGVQPQTIRKWELEGKIKALKTTNGHRRYEYTIPEIPDEEIEETSKNILYARVSSYKQNSDLQRQVEFLQSKYPKFQVITDIGGGLNFQRKGFKTILERMFSGTIERVVVAHKDRLCRFGFELLEWIFEKHGVVLEVIEDHEEETFGELTNDILSVITHFTTKLYGSRKYKGGQFQDNKSEDLSFNKNEEVVSSLLRGIEVFLQPDKRISKKQKEQGKVSLSSFDEEDNNEQ